MKKIFALLTLVVCSGAVLGQQRPHYTLYNMNNYLLNPAITGIEDYTDVKIGSRHQWVGLEGAPVTYFFSAHTPLNKQARTVKGKAGKTTGKPGGTRKINYNRFVKPYPHHGAGIVALSDKTGPLRRSNLTMSYAYHIPLNKEITLATGASGGLLQNSFNPQEATFVTESDPAITSQFVNYSYFDASVGTWLYGEDFFFGLSGAQLLKSKRDINSTGPGSGKLQQHYFITGGVKLRATPTLTFVPSTMVKFASPSPVSVDINLKAIYADRLWMGASYRTQDAFSAMVGVNVSYLMEIGYAYDANSSNLNVSNSGSHEIVLGLKLFNRSKVVCPRWLH